EDGKGLVPSGPITFTLADTTAPRILTTVERGRTVSIQFNKALDPTTVTLGNVFVLRQGAATSWPPSTANLSSYINLNSDPRTKISYDALTTTVTLDYSGLPQTEMPTDNYAIVVLSTTSTGSGVTDVVGNPLDGEFSGVFPSGNGQAGGTFIQNLGLEA